MEQLLQSNLQATAEDLRPPGGQVKFPEMRTWAQVTPTRNQHKPFNQPFPPRAKIKRKKYHNPKAQEKETTSGASQRKKKKMKIQRNTAQMKEQSRNSQDQINEEEISNLPEREFRIMIVKML